MSADSNHINLDELLAAERITLDVTIAGLENPNERKDKKRLVAIARALKIPGLKSIHLINLFFQKKAGKKIATEEDYESLSEIGEEAPWKREDSFSGTFTSLLKQENSYSETFRAVLKKLETEAKNKPRQDLKSLLKSFNDKNSSLTASNDLEDPYLVYPSKIKLIKNWNGTKWAEQMRYNEDLMEFAEIKMETLTRSSSNNPEKAGQVEKEEYNDSQTMNNFLYPEDQALLDELNALDQLNFEALKTLNRKTKKQFANDCATSSAVLKNSSSKDSDTEDYIRILEAMEVFQRAQNWSEQNWTENQKEVESRSEQCVEFFNNWKKESQAEEMRRDNEKRLNYLEKRRKVMKSAIETAIETIQTMNTFVFPEYQGLLDELKTLKQLNREALEKLKRRSDAQFANECAPSTSSPVLKNSSSKDLDTKPNDEWDFVSDSDGQSSSEPTDFMNRLLDDMVAFLRRNRHEW
ncbi:hypothetical protein B9Z55_023270 [Caenorhabditis nigoni]|uniref:Uncharacterized protein n=1 Tax=Caenorhabditis nigoni TaxID=1611254 RepID=A0A2G5SP53_9PELO|nr:hypothetical protein B9Z55_023270 [Caenorhabditis nigoni]